MINKRGRIQCDKCSAFIGVASIARGEALHTHCLDYKGNEVYESLCPKCPDLDHATMMEIERQAEKDG